MTKEELARKKGKILTKEVSPSEALLTNHPTSDIEMKQESAVKGAEAVNIIISGDESTQKPAPTVKGTKSFSNKGSKFHCNDERESMASGKPGNSEIYNDTSIAQAKITKIKDTSIKDDKLLRENGAKSNDFENSEVPVGITEKKAGEDPIMNSERLPIKVEEVPESQITAISSAGEKEKGKRGRPVGTVLVNPKDRRKTVSISVDPRDEELYKRVLANNPKRFKGLSQLIEQALDTFIRDNNLI